MNKIVFKWIALIIVVLNYSCSNNSDSLKETQNSFGEIINKELNYPSDSIKLEVIPAKNPLRVKAGNPKIILDTLNNQCIAECKIVYALSPRVLDSTIRRVYYTSVKDSVVIPSVPIVKMPTKFTVNPNVIIPGSPDVTSVKDLDVKSGQLFGKYSIAQGLESSMIDGMALSEDGCIWFGNSGAGLVKYDGKYFTTYSELSGLPGNYIRGLFIDKKGNIWMGLSNQGICVFNGRYFTHYNLNELAEDNTPVTFTEDSSGNIWIGLEQGGIVKFDGKSFFNYTEKQGLVQNAVRCLKFDKNGLLWIGTNDGLAFFDGETFKYYNFKHGLIHNNINSITTDNQNRLWIGTASGISCFDGEKFINYTGFLSDWINDITIDKNDFFWISIGEGRLGFDKYSEGGGVCKFDGQKYFTKYNSGNNLSTHNTKTLFDKNNNLWISSEDNGLQIFQGNTFSTITEKNGIIDKRVSCFTRDKNGNVWFGTDVGLSIYDGQKFKNYTEKEGLLKAFFIDNHFVNTLLTSKSGKIWFSTGGGISNFDGEYFESYRMQEGLKAFDISGMKEDKQGNLWILLLSRGLVKFDGKVFNNYTFKGLEDWYNCLYIDKKNTIWIGTEEHGVICFDGKSIRNFTKKNGLSSNSINAISEDSYGNFWFGSTFFGVDYYNGKHLVNINKNNNLASNKIKSLTNDFKGNLWIGTDKGVSKLTREVLNKLNQGADLSDFSDEILSVNYNIKDGFTANSCLTNSSYSTENSIYWGGHHAVSIYNQNNTIIDTNPPELIIRNIKLFGQDINWNQLGIIKFDSAGNQIVSKDMKQVSLPNGILLHDIKFEAIADWNNIPLSLKLPYDINNVTIEFQGIQLKGQEHVKYQFILEGYDDKWSVLVDKNEASFGNLSPGQYVFKLKAKSYNGICSKILEYKFEILPPWWQTWWFKTLVGIILIGSIILYIKWRERTLKLRQKELEETVTIRTAEVVHKNHLIEEKQKEILDSINYAKRIQYTLLAHDEFLKDNLPEHFTYFNPKDIVSGDFYWATKHNDKFYLAVCDSTGHGVPGAFMSLLNIGFLSEAINEKGIEKPNEVFDYVRMKLTNTISKEGQKDGFDGILICFDQKNKSITYAAANNAPILIKKGPVAEFVEEPADRMPVGVGERKENFTLHNIDARKGDMLYLYTDGYADQFGGPKGKKFKYKQLNELLVSLHTQPLSQQYSELKSAFEKWRGDLEQVDDVCVIGIRI